MGVVIRTLFMPGLAIGLASPAISEAEGGDTNRSGAVAQIPNSTRFLSTNNSGTGGLAFSPDGRFLVVVERPTNSIDVFNVKVDGTLSPTVAVNPSLGQPAFSVSFTPSGAALVSETGPAGVPNGSAISSYAINADGTISPISTSHVIWFWGLAQSLNRGPNGTSVSVRSVVSHGPVSRPIRSMVAMAWDTESCRYPFSSPMTRRYFFGGEPD